MWTLQWWTLSMEYIYMYIWYVLNRKRPCTDFAVWFLTSSDGQESAQHLCKCFCIILYIKLIEILIFQPNSNQSAIKFHMRVVISWISSLKDTETHMIFALHLGWTYINFQAPNRWKIAQAALTYSKYSFKFSFSRNVIPECWWGTSISRDLSLPKQNTVHTVSRGWY
jgi:hypothetical protein